MSPSPRSSVEKNTEQEKAEAWEKWNKLSRDCLGCGCDPTEDMADRALQIFPILSTKYEIQFKSNKHKDAHVPFLALRREVAGEMKDVKVKIHRTSVLTANLFVVLCQYPSWSEDLDSAFDELLSRQYVEYYQSFTKKRFLCKSESKALSELQKRLASTQNISTASNVTGITRSSPALGNATPVDMTRRNSQVVVLKYSNASHGEVRPKEADTLSAWRDVYQQFLESGSYPAPKIARRAAKLFGDLSKKYKVTMNSDLQTLELFRNIGPSKWKPVFRLLGDDSPRHCDLSVILCGQKSWNDGIDKTLASIFDSLDGYQKLFEAWGRQRNDPDNKPLATRAWPGLLQEFLHCGGNPSANMIDRAKRYFPLISWKYTASALNRSLMCLYRINGTGQGEIVSCTIGRSTSVHCNLLMILCAQEDWADGVDQTLDKIITTKGEYSRLQGIWQVQRETSKTALPSWKALTVRFRECTWPTDAMQKEAESTLNTLSSKYRAYREDDWGTLRVARREGPNKSAGASAKTSGFTLNLEVILCGHQSWAEGVDCTLDSFFSITDSYAQLQDQYYRSRMKAWNSIAIQNGNTNNWPLHPKKVEEAALAFQKMSRKYKVGWKATESHQATPWIWQRGHETHPGWSLTVILCMQQKWSISVDDTLASILQRQEVYDGMVAEYNAIYDEYNSKRTSRSSISTIHTGGKRPSVLPPPNDVSKCITDQTQDARARPSRGSESPAPFGNNTRRGISHSPVRPGKKLRIQGKKHQSRTTGES